MKEKLLVLTYNNNDDVICAAKDIKTIQKVESMECYYNDRQKYAFNIKEIPVYNDINEAVEDYSSKDKVYFDVLLSMKNGSFDFCIETASNVGDFGISKIENRITFYVKENDPETINVRGYINRIVSEYDNPTFLHDRIKAFIAAEYQSIKEKYNSSDIIHAFENKGLTKDGSMYLGKSLNKKEPWLKLLDLLNEECYNDY